MMQFKKNTWLSMLGVLLALNGCATEPLTPLEGPVSAPQRFKGADTRANDIQARWWEAYHDEVLNQLVETTLRENPNLGIVYARLRASREQVKATAAGSRPSVEVAAGVGNSRTSANSPFGVALGRQSIRGNQYTLGSSVAWEPDIWRRVANAVEVADTKVVLAKIEIDSYMLILCAEVVQFYWQLRAAEMELAVMQAIQRSRADTERVLASRYQGGFIGELDLARARVELANAEADLEDVRKRRALNEHSLATLTGRPIAEFSVAPIYMNVDKDFLLPPPPAMTPGLPIDIVARRPDLAETGQNIRAAIASRHIAQAASYPSVKVTGDFGFASKELDALTNAGSRQFSVGPLTISLPVFDGGRIQANLATADARFQEAVAVHKSKLLLALKEVEDALTEISSNEDALKKRQAALESARRANAIAKFRYDKGLANYLDVMDSERTLLAVERGMLQNRALALVASVQLVRALGGSWNAGEGVTPAQLYQ